MNLPNRITVLRIFLIPVVIVLMMIRSPGAQVAAAVVFIVAALTDLIDGKIARSRNLVTDFGKFLDPIADKLLVLGAMTMLVEQGKLAGWIVIVFLAREFVISAFRMIAASSGTVIAAGQLGKIKTLLQSFAVPMLMLLKPTGDAAPLFGAFGSVLADIFTWAAMIMAVVSCVDYIMKNRQIMKGWMM